MPCQVNGTDPLQQVAIWGDIKNRKQCNQKKAQAEEKSFHYFFFKY